MVKLREWQFRPPEEANLFNPAFLGSLVYEFVKAFTKVKPDGAPLTYVPVVMAVALHKPMRQSLPSSTVSSLHDWLLKNEQVLIGFPERTCGVTPYVKEALRFVLQRDCIRFDVGHFLVTGDQKAHFSSKFLQDTTRETEEIVSKIKFLARWFAKSGSETTVLSSWRVSP